MFKPKFSITPRINKALDEIERVRGFLDAVKLKDEWITDMQKNALITGLVEKNILKKVGEKKGTHYILAQKVIEKIRDIEGHG
ncbi:hypothetical protein KJ633_03720 [bacterium]|nr:hypothetical protein [bacterium]MBU3955547.1 hypothetical protein [bacterium]